MSQKAYQEKRLRPIIIAFGVFVLGIILIAVLGINGFFHTNPYGQGLSITNFNKYYPDMPQDTKDSLFASLYKNAQINTPTDSTPPKSGAEIRQDSTSNDYNEKTEFHQGSFIVDIDQIKQSFKIDFAWTTKEQPGVPNTQIAVQCLNGSESKYNSTNCKDDYESDAAQILYAKYPFLNELPQTISYYTDNYATLVYYKISYKYDDNTTKLTFVIDDYSGDSRELATQKIIDFGVEPKDYTIEYNDESYITQAPPRSE